jgi:anti-sigma factor RsiW
MTCCELTEFLIDFVSGRLPPEQHACCQEHLCDCPECVCYLRTYHLTVYLARAAHAPPADPPPMPEPLVRAILAARAAQPGPGGPSAAV